MRTNGVSVTSCTLTISDISLTFVPKIPNINCNISSFRIHTEHIKRRARNVVLGHIRSCARNRFLFGWCAVYYYQSPTHTHTHFKWRLKLFNDSAHLISDGFCQWHSCWLRLSLSQVSREHTFQPNRPIQSLNKYLFMTWHLTVATHPSVHKYPELGNVMCIIELRPTKMTKRKKKIMWCWNKIYIRNKSQCKQKLETSVQKIVDESREKGAQTQKQTRNKNGKRST